MQEFLLETVKLVNLPYTLLFGSTMIYWVLYILGAVGADLLDFDFDLDTDVDGDADIDLDGDLHSGGGMLVTVLKFLHVGDAPLTVVASVMSLGMWATSVMTNFYLNNSSVKIALALAIPIFIAGALCTRIGLKPFLPLLKTAFDETGDVVKIIGKMGTVVSMEVDSKYGQVEIAMKGSPITLNVRTRGDEVLKKGDEAVFFDRDADDDTYIVARFNIEEDEELRELNSHSPSTMNNPERSGVQDKNQREH